MSSSQPQDLSSLIRATGAKAVIVKLYLSEENISQEWSRAQLNSARVAGCKLGGYVWCYRDLNPMTTVKEAIALARSCGVELKTLWLDCEPYTDGSFPSYGWIVNAVNACRGLGVQPGIYTGKWFWAGPSYLSDPTGLSTLPLWTAQYDGIPDLAVFDSYGGWTACVGKQYGTVPVDTSIFLASYF